MLGNVVPLWETMLAAMKLGAVMIPASTLLQRDELADRLERGRVAAVITDRCFTGRFEGLPGAPVRIAVGGAEQGWIAFERSTDSSMAFQAAPIAADDLLLLYFTSGTTAKPKLVAHTQTSYPVGHLSTAYWIGLRRGDVHLNLSSPGWAKHARIQHDARHIGPRDLRQASYLAHPGHRAYLDVIRPRSVGQDHRINTGPFQCRTRQQRF